MSLSKLRNLHGIVAILCLIVLPLQVQAKTKPAQAAQPSKERLVLMPLRLGEADQSRQAAMEVALLEGLQQKYQVFSGEQVAKKAREIFMKESKNTAHKECDETRCLQGIAEAFQAELLAIASVSKQDDGYFLALSVQNIFDNKVVYSKSMPCKGCDAYQVVDRLKELSWAGGNTEADDAAMAAERKLKAEQLKQEQLVFEQKLRDADATERKRLLEAKAQDDKRLAELKAAAEARRKNTSTQPSGVFPTAASAVAEIKRLKDRIAAIETGYEKELAQTRRQVSQRYAAQLAALEKTQRDEFETAADFKAKQEQKRNELTTQRDAELARLNVTALAAAETAPLRDKINALSGREYAVSSESLVVELGAYNAETQQFPVSIHSKIQGVQWAMSGTIPLPIAEAKLFKQQWGAGLVRVEAKIKPSGEASQIILVNDADNTHLVNVESKFRNEELNLWKIAKAENSARAMQTLIEKYPTSTYAATAKEMLSIIQKEETERAPGKIFKDCSDCPEMVVVPMGSFDMGSNDFFSGNKNEKPVHHVTFGQSYAIGKTEVTQGQWKAVMGSNPSNFQNCGDSCPVENVNWNDAQEYIKKINNMTGKQYRLPSEAEWEYACRGGGAHQYCGGDEMEAVGWYMGNNAASTHPVGQKQANAYGIYDMSGNVLEWTEDFYHEDYNGAPVDGSVWRGDNLAGIGRMIRGGTSENALNMRALGRLGYFPGGRDIKKSSIGFRLAMTLH